MYLSLSQDCVLHILRELALVKKSGSQRPMRLSREAAELLSRCDGETSFESILQGHVEGSGRGSDFDVCKSLLAISRLIELGLVARRDRPLPTRPRITRELDAYYPASLHVELTARCNLRCFFCYREAGPEVREPRLETRELLRILSDLRDRGLTTVELTGGEPLLHPDFPEILDFCGENFATIVLLTNGTVMTDALLDALVSQREKLFVNVSLDNHDPEEHDRRRGRRGSFQKTTRTIRTLARHGIWVRVAMAVDEDSWEDVEPTLLLARELGASRFSYSPIQPFGRAEDTFDKTLWNLEARRVLEKEKELQKRHGDFLHLLDEEQTEQLNQAGSCGAGHRAYAMDPQGNVRLCVSFDSAKGVIGSLATQAPEEVFSHPLARASAELPGPREDLCGSCRFSLFCRNCLLRGLTAMEWVGDGGCRWREQPRVRLWMDLYRQSWKSGAASANPGKRERPAAQFQVSPVESSSLPTVSARS